MNEPFINERTQVIESDEKDLTESQENVKKKYWDKEYIKNRISSIKNKRHKMLLQFLWMTGTRISEAVNIKKRDIDFDNHTVQIRWQKRKNEEKRNIPLHPNLVEILDFYCGNMNLDDYIFDFSRQRAHQICRKHLGGNPHKLRHSFAVQWLRSGNRLETLSRVLGHSDIRITMEYLKIVPQDQGKEMLNMEF